MKQIISFLLVWQLIAVCSCSKTAAPDPPPSGDTTVHVNGITIEPAEFVLLPGLSQQLTVHVTPANAGNKNVTWSCSDNSVATVSSDGLVTAVKEGSTDVTATSTDNSSVKYSAKLHVLRNYELYIAGNGATDYFANCALFWKNGTPSTLTGGGFLVGWSAYAITLVGDDVYIAGSIVNTRLWDIPTYWKNNVPHVLADTNASTDTYTRSIAVVNNKVYVAGYTFYDSECPVYCNGRNRAFYWVDDGTAVSATALFDESASTNAYGIACNGSDIVVAGATAHDQYFRWANLWTNTFTNTASLSPLNGFYEARAVQLHGADTWFTGYGGCPDYGCNATAFVWKNDMGNATALTDGTRDAQAYCMAFSGDVLYVGGYERNDAGKYVAKYWKISGGSVSSCTLSDGTYNEVVNGIAVSGDDVFLVGTATNPDTRARKAKCWRSYQGFSTAQSLDISAYAVPGGHDAYGIFIK